jgi:serine/threonine protein kinase
LAPDIRTGKKVVIKILHKKRSDELDQRIFEREVEILASVDRPTFLGFYGFAPVDIDAGEGPAIVSEFAAGGSFQGPIDAERTKGSPCKWDGIQLITLFGIGHRDDAQRRPTRDSLKRGKNEGMALSVLALHGDISNFFRYFRSYFHGT